MTEQFDHLKTALSDRYTIERFYDRTRQYTYRVFINMEKTL